MKPIKLVIEGINSFTDAQTLDFEAVGRSNLFCISGKTGAGKTTVFDSLMLALYGRSGKGNLADVVNLSRMSARVTLDFEENGDRYTVERTIKCRAEKGSEDSKTERRVAVTDCTLYKNGAPAAKGADEANEVIRGIIGLEESEFKNVYLLEQGEYAEFLKKTPTKQTEAVGKIFSLMRFGDVQKLAGEKKREAETEVSRLDEAIRELGEATPELVRERVKEAAAIKAKITASEKTAAAERENLDKLRKTRDEYISVKEKQKHVKDLMLRLDEAKKRVYTADVALAEFKKTSDLDADNRELKDLRDRLAALIALNALDKEYAAAVADGEQKRRAAQKTHAKCLQAESEQSAAEQKMQADRRAYTDILKTFGALASAKQNKSTALATAVAVMGGEDVSAAEITETSYALFADKREYDALKAELDGMTDRAAQAKKACDGFLSVIDKFNSENRALAADKAKAQAAEELAQKALSSAQLRSHAAAVRSELHVGDVCPVCGGAYCGGVADGDTDIDAAKSDYDRAAKALAEVASREAECVKHLDRAKDDYDRAVKEKTRIDEEQKTKERQISQSAFDPELYGKLFDTLKAAKSACEAARISADKFASGKPVVAALKAEEAASEKAAAEIEQKATELKARLGENCGATEAKKQATEQRIAALEQKASATEEKLKALGGEADGAKAAAAAIEASLAAAKADCPVDIPEFDEGKYNDMLDAFDRLNASIAELKTEAAVKDSENKTLAENCERREKRLADRKECQKRADIYGEIAELTKSKAMLNYVAAEYIAEFTAVAGEILNGLSGGKYTMSYDKQNGFVVSDYLNDGKSRKTDTLSGGELFLASLSVAIAIARTQSRGNNAFFFLDEGFGTLDEDLIDTVYGALESLAQNCLVGVISHSNALIEKMPSCVEVLEATDLTGSIIKY